MARENVIRMQNFPSMKGTRWRKMGKTIFLFLSNTHTRTYTHKDDAFPHTQDNAIFPTFQNGGKCSRYHTQQHQQLEQQRQREERRKKEEEQAQYQHTSTHFHHKLLSAEAENRA